MTDIIKVAVRIPAGRKAELLTLTALWRAKARPDRSGGWDAKEIKRIVDKHYGGKYRKLFDAHGWVEPDGRRLMITAPKLICADPRYGSIEAFARVHDDRPSE